MGVKRGIWTSHEDKLLHDYIISNGIRNWRTLPAKAGLNRCGKSCRLRWLNYLRPDIKRGSITKEEADLILRLHNLLGNKWSLIAGRLPGRTDNEIKNYWNSCLRKKAMHGDQSKLRGESSHKLDEMKAKESGMDPTIIHTKAIRCTSWSTLMTDQTRSHKNNSFAPTTWQSSSSDLDPFLDYFSGYDTFDMVNYPRFELNDGSNYSTNSMDENSDLMRSGSGEMEELQNDAWDSFSF